MLPGDTNDTTFAFAFENAFLSGYESFLSRTGHKGTHTGHPCIENGHFPGGSAHEKLIIRIVLSWHIYSRKKAQFKLHRFDQELPKDCLEKSAEKQGFLFH